jgi:hypothetical protein
MKEIRLMVDHSIDKGYKSVGVPISSDWDAFPLLLRANEGHIYISENGSLNRYAIGNQGEETKQRHDKVIDELSEGWFTDFVDEVKANHQDREQAPEIAEGQKLLIDAIIDGVEGEGTGIARVFCTQLVVKSITPGQNPRLHKGNRTTGDFSWIHGWSLRGIDNNADYGVGTELNERNLIEGNTEGGGVMTRALAGNYPYTPLLADDLSGPAEEWLQFLDLLDEGSVHPQKSLRYLLRGLFDLREVRQSLAKDVAEEAQNSKRAARDLEDVSELIRDHVRKTRSKATMLEIAGHSLLQVVEDEGLLLGDLQRLTATRSPDRRSGESLRYPEAVGDLEIVDSDSEEILKAFDAKLLSSPDSKLKKANVADFHQKLNHHPSVETIGILTLNQHKATNHAKGKLNDVGDEFDVDWVYHSLLELAEAFGATSTGTLEIEPVDWLTAYAETLGQLRRDRATVRVPTLEPLEDLQSAIEELNEG